MKGQQYIEIAKVARRLGVVPRTVKKWLARPELGLPRPMYVGNRGYFLISEIEAWEQSCKENVTKAA